jgi:hypothetical protein
MAIVLPKLEMVPVDFSWLSELPKIYQQRREQEDFKAALADLESGDPTSMDAARIKLLRSGPQGAALWATMENLQRQREATQSNIAHQRAQEGTSARQVGVSEGRLEDERAAARRQRELEERFQRQSEAEDAADAAAAAARAAARANKLPTTTGPAPSEPTVPKGGAGEDWWDEPEKPAAPAPPAIPGPRSDLGGASPLAAAGAMRVEPGQGELSVSPDTFAAQSRLGPQFAQAAGATRTDVPTVPTTLAPVAAPPGRPKEQEIQMQEPSEEEIAHRAKARRLIRQSEDPALSAQGAAGRRAAAAMEETEAKRLEDIRKAIYLQRTKAAEQAASKREAVESKPLGEIIDRMVTGSGGIQRTKAVLDRMDVLSRDPSALSGEYGRAIAKSADDTAQTQQLLRNVGLEGMVPQAVKDLIRRQSYDPGMRFREFESLQQQLVQAQAGDKGFADKGLSTSDREAYERAVPSVDDSPKVRQSKIATMMAWEDRKEKIMEIQAKGIKRGLGPAEIMDGIAKYANKHSLMEASKQKLIELNERARGGAKGGEAAPQGAPQAQQPARAAPPPPAEVREYGGKRWRYLGGNPREESSWRAE